MMSGHGWIVPNLGGSKARCGGPTICSACQNEARELGAWEKIPPHRLTQSDLQQVSLEKKSQLEQAQIAAAAAERQKDPFQQQGFQQSRLSSARSKLRGAINQARSSLREVEVALADLEIEELSR